MVTNFHLEWEQLKDRFKDLGEELIEANLREEGRQAQSIFFSASLLDDLKQMLLNVLKEFKDLFCMDKC